MNGRTPRPRRQFAVLAVVVGVVTVVLAGVLIANAAGVAPTAVQIPSWKIAPPSQAPPPPARYPTGSIPPFSPQPAPAGVTCANPGFSLPAGIITAGQGPFDTTSFPVHNSWGGRVGTDWIVVYAGGQSSHHDGVPDLAAVRLFEENETANHCAYDQNLLGDFTLSGHQSLTITAVSGNIMSLKTDDGNTVTFDLLMRRFQ